MRRPGPVRQQGFGLLVFVLIMAVVSFSLVLAYSGQMITLRATQQAELEEIHLKEVSARLEALWRQSAGVLDDPSVTNTVKVEDVLQAAQVQPAYRLKAVLSDVMISGDIAYRAVLLYIPSVTDESRPPDLEKFKQQGVFIPCSGASEGNCVASRYRIFSSYEMEKDFVARTQNMLRKIAYKGQAYFKARMLQDPERNISVNYFRQPLGSCVVAPQDLGCLDTFQPLSLNVLDSSAPDSVAVTRVVSNLGLSSSELVTPWNTPIEASNLEASEAVEPPFTMAFRAKLPNGQYKTVFAVQQL